MRNYVIINGVNSLTKNGLAIKDLPPITKTMMRTLREEIDGRDGDIITELGYSAYDKSMTIGLFGTGYDIDDIIAFFNQSGTIVFSNEPDKFYNFKIIDQIDYNKLLKFKEATIRFHCQPFKYPLNEVPLVEEYQYVEATGTNATLDNTSEAIFNKIDLLGNTSQTGTPTPSSPIPINVVSGDNEVVVCGKNLLPISTLATQTKNGMTFTNNNDGSYTFNGTTSAYSSFVIFTDLNFNGNYTYVLKDTTTTGFEMYLQNSGGSGIGNATTHTTKNANVSKIIIGIQPNITLNNLTITPYVYSGNYDSSFTYEPYTSQNYPLYLGVENLFDKDNASLGKGVSTSTGNLYNDDVLFSTDYIEITPNISYVVNGYSSSANRVYGACYDASKNYLTNVTTNANISTFIVTNTNAKYIRLTGFISDIDTYQLEKGTKASSYSEYGVAPIELNKINAYQDYIYKDSGKWYLHKEIGKVVLDGSENWSISNSGTANWYYLANISSKIITPNIPFGNSLSNYYQNNDIANGNTQIGFNILSNGTSLTNIRVRYGTEDTTTNYKKWLSTNNVIVYSPLATPTNTEITDTTLLEQLEAIKNAVSYRGQTNITQTNNDLPFILDLSALELNSDHLVINNIGSIYSKPTLDLEGTGIVDIYLNDIQMFEVDLTENNEIIINTDEMEAFNPETGALANRQVTGEYDVFKLDPGENDLRFSGNLTKATITNYERWL